MKPLARDGICTFLSPALCCHGVVYTSDSVLYTGSGGYQRGGGGDQRGRGGSGQGQGRGGSGARGGSTGWGQNQAVYPAAGGNPATQFFGGSADVKQQQSGYLQYGGGGGYQQQAGYVDYSANASYGAYVQPQYGGGFVQQGYPSQQPGYYQQGQQVNGGYQYDRGRGGGRGRGGRGRGGRGDRGGYSR